MFLFFFNDTATTEIYPLSLHDALPICELGDVVAGRVERLGLGGREPALRAVEHAGGTGDGVDGLGGHHPARRSEEHTSELQSQSKLVCRLLLEKKKTKSLCDRLI